MVFRILCFLFISFSCYAVPGYHEPWGKDADLRIPEPQTQTSLTPAAWVTNKIISFHQNIISPVDGPRSHFRPSSSQYMNQAVQKYGFLPGVLMGLDRLMRENSDEWVYRTVEYDGTLYKYDPP